VVPERLAAVLAELAPVAERFEAADHRLYLVGGIVRDLLLGRPVGEGDDFDLTTDARPDEIEAIVGPIASSVWLQGKRFGTVGAMVDGRELEITTHRAEAYRPDSRKPEVRFADAVEADLSRRDFTVNAMALRLSADTTAEGVQLIDPFDGAADLAAGRLRTPLDPETSFTDDPLRMLRAARFLAGYGLRPDDDLVAAVRALHDRLEIVSAERIRDELDRLVVVDEPGAGLWFLVDTGLAGEFLPELPALAVAQDPGHRHKDVLAHTIAVVERAPADRVLRLAALFHDVGKPKTRSFEPGGRVTFHHHEVVGARMTRERMTALRYPADDIEQVSRLVELHLRFHGYDEGEGGWTDSAVRRYARDAGPLLDRLNDLTRADCTTRNRRKAAELEARMDRLQARIEALRQSEALEALRPDLDGNEVMRHLGLPPGPVVGQALAFLKELRIEEGPLGAEEARRRLDAWWAERAGA
jgi:poly(A) polymerase